MSFGKTRFLRLHLSRETLQDAMRKLQSNKGAVLYAIGLTDGAEGMSRAGRDALQDLATSTGGAAYFPQRVEDVDTITRSVARDLRSQYTLTYNPAVRSERATRGSTWKPEGLGARA